MAVAALAGVLAVGGVWTAVPILASSSSTMAHQVFSNPDAVALAEAAATGRVAEVQRLLDAGVDVNAKGLRGMTPLGYAILHHNLAGMEALLKRGADSNFAIDDAAYKTAIPFILVVGSKGTADEMVLLLRYGGNANAREPVKANAKANEQYEADSLLTLSVMDLVKVKALVEHGADINYVPHPDSASVGHASAAVSAAGLGQLEVVEYLIDRGASDLDEIADALQGRPWNELKKRRLAILKKIKAAGGRIYLGYRPVRSNEVEMYPPQDTPAEWITPGFIDMRELRQNRLHRWEQQQGNRTK